MIQLKHLVIILTLCFDLIISDLNSQSKTTSLQFSVLEGARLNNEFELKSSFDFDEKKIEWKFEKDDDSPVELIYAQEKLEKPDKYECLPSLSSCRNLKILNVTKNDIGEYLRKSESFDDKKNTIGNYFLYAYESPIVVKCNLIDSYDEKCDYNPETKTLIVKDDVMVNIQCVSNILTKPGSFEENLRMDQYFNSENSCNSSENRIEKNRIEQLFQIKSECSRTFKKHENVHQCILKKTKKRLESDINTEDIELDKLDITIKIKYWPIINESESNLANLMVILRKGETKELNCPYYGFPIEYKWFFPNSNDSNALSKNKTFKIPNTLQEGNHKISCQAYTPGEMKSMTKPFTYTITINNNKVNKGKLYVIIGSVIGGIILVLILLAIIVVVLKRNKGKDNINKPHEAEPLRN